jgi:tRNA nucleotidyltransferase (CCA-adding enzyme)
VERLFEEFKKWLLKPGKPSLGLRAFLDIKLDEYFPEIRSFENSWDTLGAVLDNMAALRDSCLAENKPCSLSEAQTMEFAFAALLADSADTSLKFLERITNEVHLLKIVPPLLKLFREIAPAIVAEAPALRRLAVKLGGLKLLCLLVQCAPREFFATDCNFAEKLWRSAAEYDLLEAAPQPYLTGKMLMDLGVKPGKQMGDIIKASFELQLDGKIANAEAALAWAKEIIA